ncbi:MAG: GatB/YqeY domain-containing protein [Candidatus Omnitrophota bacterium]
MLKERIEKEFKEALKEKDSVKVSVLRMIKAELLNLVIQKKEELKEESVIKVIQKQINQRKDSIEQFKKGNREDLVAKEEKELAILETFLPNMLSEDELAKLVKEVIAELGAATKKEMGGVIKAVIAKAEGRADGRAVSQIVSSLLK